MSESESTGFSDKMIVELKVAWWNSKIATQSNYNFFIKIFSRLWNWTKNESISSFKANKMQPLSILVVYAMTKTFAKIPVFGRNCLRR